LVRLNLAIPLKSFKEIPRGGILLNPFSPTVFSAEDRGRILRRGITAIDMSWKRIEDLSEKDIPRCEVRALPLLIAANPTNYGKPTKLSTVEALFSSLYIIGEVEESLRLISKFKWGREFLRLNQERLERYRSSPARTEVLRWQKLFLEELGLQRAL
jgi:pre-rRNA-processing protein TSR3